MAKTETIKEFLVKLGYDVDHASEARFRGALDAATKAVVGLASAFATYKVVDKIFATVAAFDKLYYAAQRMGASAGNVKAFGYAVSQLGGSIDGANASLEEFGRNLRENPKGISAYLEGIGVKTKDAGGRLRDSTAVLVDLGKRLREEAKKNYYVAKERAALLGIDENTFRTIIDPNFEKRYKEYNSLLSKFGLDPQKVSENSARVEQLLRKFQMAAEVIFDRLVAAILPFMEKGLDALIKWVEDHQEDIEEFFRTFAEVVSDLYNAIKNFLSNFDYKKAWNDFIDGAKKAYNVITSLWKGMSWLVDKANELFGIGTAHANTPESVGATSGADEYIKKGGAVPDSGYEPAHHPRYDPSTGTVTPGGAPGPDIVPKSKSGGSSPTVGDVLGIPKPGTGSMPRGQRLNAEQKAEMASAIRETAAELGIDPAHLAAVISFETGGTMDPLQPGPVTKWGRHRGLIQWGEPQSRNPKYWGEGKNLYNSTIREQLRAVGRYMKERGVRPGMALENVYGSVLAGAAEGKLDVPDKFGTTPRSGAARMWRTAHRNALAALEGGGSSVGSLGSRRVGTFEKGDGWTALRNVRSVPIGAPTPSNNNSSVSTSNVNAPVNVTINGVSDPHEAVREFERAGSRVANNILRNVGGKAQ